jgi:hypothetical protein
MHSPPLKYKGKCLFLGRLSFTKHSRHLGSSFEDIVYVRLCYLRVLPSLIDERALLLDEECLFLHVVYVGSLPFQGCVYNKMNFISYDFVISTRNGH